MDNSCFAFGNKGFLPAFQDGFPMLIERLFTTGSVLPHDMTRFVCRSDGKAPEDWNLEAVEAFAEALYARAPTTRKALEENTLPSWLWRHRAEGTDVSGESGPLAVFDRVAGAAAYKGWKLGLWKNEVEASTFFDETRAVLLTRRLVFAPKILAKLGLDWAYGSDSSSGLVNPLPRASDPSTLILQNETIDSILSGHRPSALGKWNRFLEASQNKERVGVAFADTIAEWTALPISNVAPRAMLNLMAFRHDDGSLDIAGLQQTAKIGVILLDLYYSDLAPESSPERALSIGFGNLAALLMSLGFAYDSDAGRGLAAAIAALMTASTLNASAKLAAKLGSYPAFIAHRESALRGLENRLRAAFGEKNDYDRLSILPRTLDIESGVDLVALSAARYAFEEALVTVRKHGLRHGQLTALFHEPSFAPLTGAFSQGIEPESVLSCDYAVGTELFERQIHPVLPLALERLGYDRADIQAIRDHLAGYRTLAGAPGINHVVLREKGFTEEALKRLEGYLSRVNHIRLAFTPWVLGKDFCVRSLRISNEDLLKPTFDLLRHLGFSAQDVTIANAFCCGREKLKGALEINEQHLPIFALRDDLPPEALIRMAASVQSFIMGDVALKLSIPASLTPQVRGQLLLMAWEQGLRSLTLHQEGPPSRPTASTALHGLLKRRTEGMSSPTGERAAVSPHLRAKTTPSAAWKKPHRQERPLKEKR